MATDQDDLRRDAVLMRSALALARRGLGQAWPNPAVGCVISKEGRVIGRGWTQPGGRPHAETEALSRAGERARGATAHVSLEPCCHHGRTGPCSAALIASGVKRVVVALEDPDPRVSGGGIAALREAGIDVELGLCAEEAAEVISGFLMRISKGRPLVTLKLATSLDGRIATASGESRWISGPPARERAHLLRATHDAVLVGTGTVIADDPRLDCRLPGLEDRSPVRVALDRRLTIPLGTRFVTGARATPTWILTLPSADLARRAALEAAGVVVIAVEAAEDAEIDIAAALAAIAGRGVTRLLVEGGGKLAASLLGAQLVDRIAWFHAPLIIGDDGAAAVAELGLAALQDAPGFRRVGCETIGEDVLTHYRRSS